MHDQDGMAGGTTTERDEAPQPMVDGSPVAVAVDRLVELSAGGRALELGIGGGRIAIPLAARGVDVVGIDISTEAVEHLRRMPGGASIPVTLGDFSKVRADGTFSLAYLVFNTIMNLTSQPAQVACFRTVAAQLEPGGALLIETMVPALRLLPPGERHVVFDLSPTHWGIDEYDVASQGLVSHHLEIRGGRAIQSSGPFRYVWPAELDLMAELAGMRLEARWSGWRREPFTNESRQHVSIWRAPA